MDIGALNNIVSYIPGSCKEAIASEIDILVNAISERDSLRAELQKEKSRTSEVLFFCSSDTRLHFFNKWSEEYQAPVPAMPMQDQASISDYEEVLADKRRLTRELDVLLNGEDGAAKQASLCDLVSQVGAVVRAYGKPLLPATPIPKQEQSISRQSIIDVLLSTAGLSEGITADAIIEAIGARQEAVVAVPECFMKLYHHAIGMRSGEDWNIGTQAAYHTNNLLIALNNCEDFIQLGFAVPSPRITEQDAREIISDYLEFHGDGKSDSEIYKTCWLKNNGRALLDKLNGKS